MYTQLEEKKSHSSLRPEQLRWRCAPSSLPFETTDELEPLRGFIGQDRAIKALTLGLTLHGAGYHILVRGTPGTGRKALVREVINTLAQALDGCMVKKGHKGDLVYVHNFKDVTRPLAIILPPGKGAELREAMERSLERLEKKVTAVLASEFVRVRAEIVAEASKKHRDAIRARFEEETARRSFCFAPGSPPEGVLPQCIPLTDEGPLDIQTLAKKARKGEISRRSYETWRRSHAELVRIRTHLLKEILTAERRAMETMQNELRSILRDVVHLEISAIKQSFRGTKLRTYLDQVEAALVDYYVRAGTVRSNSQEHPEAYLPHHLQEIRSLFRVHVLVEAQEPAARPCIEVPFPSLQNLFGSVSNVRTAHNGNEPPFLTIVPGAFHRAHGGHLLVDVGDIVRDEQLWRAFKQCLKTNLIEIPQTSSPSYAPPCIWPEPFPLAAKVVAVIDEDLYQHVLAHDPEIEELFKIKADVEEVLERNPQHIIAYCRFLAKLTREEGLPPFHRTGAAALIETAVERAGKQTKLTARFSDIADVAREAAYWARQEKSPMISDRHVETALAERRYRNNLPHEQLKELIKEGTIYIETQGAKIGQVNGIALYDLGEHVFASPCRITAQTSMGRAGVINIEREANLSGKLHDKGVLILYGYLRDRYAHDKPLNLSASICIEQFYTDIEGDSASLAEICALLSSLATIPVSQGIAVTGSISQKGEVQPVGCVNEKVAGFFDICKQRGLTGEQGVIIPSGNLGDLMFPVEIVSAVEQGRFHIYEARSVDDAMEILTGLPAGVMHPDHGYPEGTINRRVDDRLRDLAEGLRDFYNEVAEEDERWSQE